MFHGEPFKDVSWQLECILVFERCLLATRVYSCIIQIYIYITINSLTIFYTIDRVDVLDIPQANMLRSWEETHQFIKYCKDSNGKVNKLKFNNYNVFLILNLKTIKNDSPCLLYRNNGNQITRVLFPCCRSWCTVREVYPDQDAPPFPTSCGSTG